jgi:hypothetical protein
VPGSAARGDGLLRSFRGSLMLIEVIDPNGGAQLDVVDKPVVDMSSTAEATPDLASSA